MNVITQILATTVLAGVAAAQSAQASQMVRPNVPQTKVQSGASSLKSPFAPKTQAAVHKRAMKVADKKTETKAADNKSIPKKVGAAPAPAHAAPVHTAQKSKAPKTATARVAKAKKPAAPAAPAAAIPSSPAPAAVASNATKLPDPGKRDPFLSPIAAAALSHGASGCTTGKRCLSVDQLVLKGIVQMKGGNFAVVENPAKHMYELRENDSLLDGSVVRITGDTVVFRENSSDILGRPVSKEVVKKVSAPAV